MVNIQLSMLSLKGIAVSLIPLGWISVKDTLDRLLSQIAVLFVPAPQLV